MESTTIVSPSEYKDLIKVKGLLISITKSSVMHKRTNEDYCCDRIGIRIQFKKRAFAIYTEKLVAIYKTEYSLAN